ncbi:response regulator [Candidatus Nitrosotenuis cloacae]|jgi:CheY-like chemotaxis protein|uniref:response regulator n=1 Tax=Candidatus Nitrosotenuis cloacae TaxID=1603555 RepID=UPI00227E977D|nr:response regulator [Candidatus Nitrosotenuis cloacae]
MLTCIVVDDDKNTTKVFSDILELMGLQIVGQGYNGDDAVSLYEEHRPDIAFIDVIMPQKDGFFALEKIRECDPQAKVVAVTADFTLETQQELENMKISAIIYKPFNPNEIKRVLLEKYEINVI